MKVKEGTKKAAGCEAGLACPIESGSVAENGRYGTSGDIWYQRTEARRCMVLPWKGRSRDGEFVSSELVGPAAGVDSEQSACETIHRRIVSLE